MIVPSIPFLGFAAIAALIFNLGTAPWWRQAILLAVNLAFLASFSQDPLAFLPFAGFLALGFAAQEMVQEGTAREGRALRRFVALLLVTLVGFVWLKRYSFVPSATFVPFPYVQVGLSYVFFRVLHLIIDRHQGAIDGRVGLVSYLNYTLNFTSLTSGPIQRYQDYRRAEVECPPLDLVVSARAIERIVVGTFKVAVVSMLLALAQHSAIDALGTSETSMQRIRCGVLVAAIYPVYLYFNFSGYMDVVIGVARFFRIALSEWLKTYVFNPLMMAGMARVTGPRLSPYIGVFAYFVTFFLVGLWHGQTTEFLFFGFLQGGGVAANKLYQVLVQERLGRPAYRAMAANPFYSACARGLTFTWFAFSLFWFWSNWGQVRGFATVLGPMGLSVVWLTIFVAATLILAGMQAARNAALRVTWGQDPVVRSRYVRTAWDTALAVVTVTVIVLLDSPAPDIVYKAF